jgi:hypothetical protein
VNDGPMAADWVPAMRLLLLFLLATLSPAADYLPEADAPAIAPRLLFVSRCGGAGDQWFPNLQVKGGTVTAADDTGALTLTVTVKPDGTVKAAVGGSRDTASKVQKQLPNGGKLGPITYGYRQVDPNLQLPFMDGPGWKLWGWTLEQAKTAKCRFAPLMADSRIRLALPTPAGTIVAIATTDGGNTSLRADPRDIDRTLEPADLGTGGGGGGTSSWLYELTSDGKFQRVLVARGFAQAAAFDAWGRMLVVGRGIIAKPMAGAFPYPDGGGLLLVDRGWKQALFTTHFGLEKLGETESNLWAVAVDSRSGLAAVAGYVGGGRLAAQNGVQADDGGGTDGFLAVFRLWPALAGKAP